MREFRKKQKKLKRIMNTLVIFTAVFLFVYIGVQPMLPDLVGQLGTVIISYVNDILIVASLVVLFVYFSKYAKSDKFLENIEYELSDAGYYYHTYDEKNVETFLKKVQSKLASASYSIENEIEVDGFTFTSRAMKRNEFFYIICDDEIDKNDIIAYQESAIYDITSVNIKRKGDGVMLYICDKACDDAIALSKMIVPLGKKEQIKFANAIVETSTGRVYFLGNNASKCQQMIANFVLGSSVPIDKSLIGNERLKCQDELEEHMKEFNIKDFKNGTFYAH